MPRTHNNFFKDDGNNSQEVFRLRKSGNLIEAYDLAVKLYEQNSNDSWVQKAYAWTLIDIVKNEIKVSSGNAGNFFNQLLSINITDDEIISKQIDFLKPRIDLNYVEVQQAEDLSKKGEHKQSLELFRNLKRQGKLPMDYHESFGWAIYRYVKAEESALQVQDVKNLLFEYLKLQNPRPELVHSVVLKFVIGYSQKHKEFDLFKFFQIWGPKNLREEDRHEEINGDKKYSSTAVRLLRQIANEGEQLDIGYLQNSIGDRLLVIDTLREGMFWQIFNLHKEGKHSELWIAFDKYLSTYSNYGASEWHSEMLKIAHRFMEKDESYRFFDFLKKWGIGNFQEQDWNEEVRGDFTSKPLVLKSLKKAFDFIKIQSNQNNDFSWVLPLYEEALEFYNDNIWLLREYATLLNILGRSQEAIKLYKNIALEKGDQAYIWHEFANLIKGSDSKTAVSMLCKAVSLQKDEDFLGAIHIDLAKLLIDTGDMEDAASELDLYKKHREKKGWPVCEDFPLIYEYVKDIEIKNNRSFHKDNINLAEEYVYSDIPWTDMLLYDQWKNKEHKERTSFSDVGDISFSLNNRKFPLLKKSNINDVYQLKLYCNKDGRFLPLKIQKSGLKKNDLIGNAKTDIALVDHVNKQKNLFHYVVDLYTDGIIRFSETEIRPSVGDFIKISFFETFDQKHNKTRIHVLKIIGTNEVKPSLLKTIEGELSLKYKTNGGTSSYEDVIYDLSGVDTDKPDFGFVNDYYVPKSLLQKNEITEDCYIIAKAIFSRGKWLVFKIDSISNTNSTKYSADP